MIKIMFLIIILAFLPSCSNNQLNEQTYSTIPTKSEDIEYIREYGDFVNDVIKARNNATNIVGTYMVFRDEYGELTFSYDDENTNPSTGHMFKIASDDQGNFKALYLYRISNVGTSEEVELIHEYFLDDNTVLIKSYETDFDTPYLFIKDDFTYLLKTDDGYIVQLEDDSYNTLYKFGLQLNQLFNRNNNDQYSQYLVTTKKSKSIEDFIPVSWRLYSGENAIITGKLNNDDFTDHIVTIERNTNYIDENNQYIFPRISFVLFGNRDGELVLNNFLSDLIPPFYADNNTFEGFSLVNKTLYCKTNDYNFDNITYNSKYLYDSNNKDWQLVGYTKSQTLTYPTPVEEIPYTLLEDYNLTNGKFKTSFSEGKDTNYFNYKEFWDTLDEEVIYYKDFSDDYFVDTFFPLDHSLQYFNLVFE